jgi:hypothetical protein
VAIHPPASHPVAIREAENLLVVTVTKSHRRSRGNKKKPHKKKKNIEGCAFLTVLMAQFYLFFVLLSFMDLHFTILI